MDMTIRIENGLIVTSLYAKPLAFHQYIPPSSCHPPGVLTGLVLGQVLRIFQLCSREHDIDNELRLFYRRLVDRGHRRELILPLVIKGVNNTNIYMKMLQEQRDVKGKAKVGKLDERVFFQIPFHPQNPASASVQRLWRDISSLHHRVKRSSRIRRIATRILHPHKVYDCCVPSYPNIDNLTSYRKLSNSTGLKASSFI